jgi:hypothetical protein
VVDAANVVVSSAEVVDVSGDVSGGAVSIKVGSVATSAAVVAMPTVDTASCLGSHDFYMCIISVRVTQILLRENQLRR